MIWKSLFIYIVQNGTPIIIKRNVILILPRAVSLSNANNWTVMRISARTFIPVSALDVWRTAVTTVHDLQDNHFNYLNKNITMRKELRTFLLYFLQTPECDVAVICDSFVNKLYIRSPSTWTASVV